MKIQVGYERELRRRIILSISSDIGTALAFSWLKEGYEVEGTFRTRTKNCELLEKAGAVLHQCDLLSPQSINEAFASLSSRGQWDVLVLAAGTTEPVGPFLESNFAKWTESFNTNFLAQMQFLHGMLPSRNKNSHLTPLVLFFAGGGTNNATVNYSAYTLSKIALIKACELLDAEVPDTRFTILGPGWVKTKIHQETLKAQHLAGNNYDRTVEMLDGDKCFPMEKVIECCDWIIRMPREIIGGRNFSAVYDKWGNPELENLLLKDMNMYKLRRAGN